MTLQLYSSYFQKRFFIKIVSALIFISISSHTVLAEKIKDIYIDSQKELQTFISRLEQSPESYERMTVTVTEAALNTYLSSQLHGSSTASDPALDLIDKDSLILQADLYFDVWDFILSRDNSNSKEPSGIKNNIYIQASILSAKGKWRITIDTLKINGLPIPGKTVELLAKRIGMKQKPPFDPSRLSKIPYNIKKISIKDDRLILEF